MNKKLLIFSVLLSFCAAAPATAAVSVKKAAPVATQQQSAASTAASFLPTVLGLVSSIQQLNAQQKALTAECIPTSQELTFVNNIVKEWAKTGAMSADDAQKKMGLKRCRAATGGYAASVQVAAGTDDAESVCYDFFGSDSDKQMVWYLFPVASTAKYCSDGTDSCAEKNKETVSNIYDVFNLVGFTTEDYTKSEATMAAKLISKTENCSHAKLSARKRQVWGDFLVQTMGSVGQSTNTGAIMESVQSVSGQGLGGLSSLGSIAAQFMDK